MNSERVLISLTPELKGFLDELRGEGYTIAGYVRNLLEQDMHEWREHKAIEFSQTAQGGSRIKARKTLAGANCGG